MPTPKQLDSRLRGNDRVGTYIWADGAKESRSIRLRSEPALNEVEGTSLFGDDPCKNAQDQGGHRHENDDGAEQDGGFLEEMGRLDRRYLRGFINDGDRGDQRQKQQYGFRIDGDPLRHGEVR